MARLMIVLMEGGTCEGIRILSDETAVNRIISSKGIGGK